MLKYPQEGCRALLLGGATGTKFTLQSSFTHLGPSENLPRICRAFMSVVYRYRYRESMSPWERLQRYVFHIRRFHIISTDNVVLSHRPPSGFERYSMLHAGRPTTTYTRLSTSIINDPLHPLHPCLSNALSTSNTLSSFKLL